MAVDITPRPLSARERDVADLILDLGFPGAGELRAQLHSARVVAMWGVNSASIDLAIPADSPRAEINGVIPVDATVVDSTGSLCGEILLWATDGHLSAIEYAWYGDEPPVHLPDVRMISTQVRVQTS